MADAGQHTVTDLRNGLYQHILKQSFAFLGRSTTGSLMSHITTDVEKIQAAVSELAGDLLKEGLSVLGLLIVLFAGGSFFDWFPLRGLVSENWWQMPWWQKVLDYFWHLTLPIIAMALSAFATMTLLTKNSFLEEIRKQYVLTARAKGCTRNQVLYGHVFRNAMLIVIAGFPSAFVHAFFTGSLLIETIFSLDGLGLLGFESVLNRDYPVVFATLYIFSLIGVVVNLISDLTYTWIDPRIDFETREV